MSETMESAIENTVARITFDQCDGWIAQSDRISHSTGRYFSIVLMASDESELVMIDQPEVGILGFIGARTEDGISWLAQNKPEPGNIHFSQIAPTVQATKSNYEQVHGGKPTPYLEYMQGDERKIIDIEGSEQGSKFVNKFNRNIKTIIDQTSEITLQDGYEWLDTATIKQKLREDYLVNTDARSVLTSGHWSLLSKDRQSCFLLDENLDVTLKQALNRSYLTRDTARVEQAISLLDEIFSSSPLAFDQIAFSKSDQHTLTESGIADHKNGDVVHFYSVSMPEREVTQWCQPLVVQQVKTACVLAFCIVEGTAFFRVNAFFEAGFKGRVEYGPTLQTGAEAHKTPRDVVDGVLENPEADVIFEIDQSDEGGRFYRCICSYSLVHWTGAPDNLPDGNGIWLTAGELEALSCVKGKLTNELRTALSLLVSFI